MDDAEKVAERLEKVIYGNQRETRENLDKLFIYLARLEVAIGKLNSQVETIESQRTELKEEICTLRDRVRRIETLFAPVTIVVGWIIANLTKRFGL